MRIIAGKNKGQKLLSLDSRDTRPTADRVKEAVFSIIQFQIEGRRFLDLYAGSASMGIEALSRGAREAVFVDKNRDAIGVIRDNLERIGLTSKARVINMDAKNFLLLKNEPFDLIYLDPPYHKGEAQRVLPQVAGLLSKGGVALCEHAKDEELPDSVRGLLKTKTYNYGKVAVSKYEHNKL